MAAARRAQLEARAPVIPPRAVHHPRTIHRRAGGGGRSVARVGGDSSSPVERATRRSSPRSRAGSRIAAVTIVAGWRKDESADFSVLEPWIVRALEILLKS